MKKFIAASFFFVFLFGISESLKAAVQEVEVKQLGSGWTMVGPSIRGWCAYIRVDNLNDPTEAAFFCVGNNYECLRIGVNGTIHISCETLPPIEVFPEVFKEQPVDNETRAEKDSE